MLDEQRVERDPVPRVDDRPELRLRLARRPGRRHSEPVRDPVDVRVDRDRGDVVAEDEDAVGRLRPDPRERGQGLERAGDLAGEPVEELTGAGPDRAGLDMIESRRPDEPFDRASVGPGEGGRIGIPREEPGARDVRVRVPGALREDRADEHLERVLGVVPEVRPPPVSGAVELREPVEHGLPEEVGRGRGAAHRGEPRSMPVGPTGAGRPSPGTKSPRPGSERSGSRDPRRPSNSSPTR